MCQTLHFRMILCYYFCFVELVIYSSNLLKHQLLANLTSVFLVLLFSVFYLSIYIDQYPVTKIAKTFKQNMTK